METIILEIIRDVNFYATSVYRSPYLKNPTHLWQTPPSLTNPTQIWQTLPPTFDKYHQHMTKPHMWQIPPTYDKPRPYMTNPSDKSQRSDKTNDLSQEPFFKQKMVIVKNMTIQ